MTNNTTSTDTFRWDTVYALHVKDINQIISQSVNRPPDLSYTSKDGWHAEACFGVWQVVGGGDGKLLHFSLPIERGVLIFNDHEQEIHGANAILELELAFFNSNGQPAEDPAGQVQHLKAKTTADGTGQKVATLIKLEFSDNENSFLLQSLLPTALENWINSNLDIFDHVFASVNLNNAIDEGKFDWVKPTAVDYAFISNEDNDKSQLGILCMTENRSPSGLLAQISPFVIPDSSAGGLLIANNRCLEKLVKPAIPMVFKNLDLKDLVLSSDQNSLQLQADKSVNIPIEHDGKSYDCDLEILNISMNESYMEIHYKAKTNIALGIEAHVESIHRYNISIKTKPDGQQTLTFNEMAPPVVNHWTTQPIGIVIAAIIIAIIAAIAIVILAIFTDGAALIIGALLIGLLSGAAIATPEVVGLVGKDDAPDLDLLISNSTDPINWTGQGKFNLNQASINGCLQLGGNYPS